MGELVERGLIPRELPADPSDQLRAMAPVYFADPTTRFSAEGASAFEVFPSAGELTAESLTTLDLTEGLRRFDGPVLMVMGSEDPFGVEWATATQRAFTSIQARLEILEACGHLGWMECPDRFFPVVESFLQSSPASEASE